MWVRDIVVSPEDCRDAVATTLRDNHINEPATGSIPGHAANASTVRCDAAKQKPS